MGKRARDESGTVYGRLTVVRRDGIRRFSATWICACECGAQKSVAGPDLRSGRVSSCGCLKRESDARGRVVHGKCHTREYISWKGAKQRCENPRNPSFKHYGARGIGVCAKWSTSFEEFLADMGPRPGGMSLDRINNNGNYEPGNCRWATQKEQGANMRSTKISSADASDIRQLCANGESKAHVARLYGVCQATVGNAIRRAGDL